ncbi:MAG: ABC transporter substrate-binding protein [Acidobacteriota bacterium]|nr:ABC transporter substrate-binding protein [Acidobacteriota bacterium]
MKPWAMLVAAMAAVAMASGPSAFQASEGITDSEIVVGMSAPFTGASRSLGIELYRGSMAYLTEVNRRGGVNGRTIAVRAYDDGYQPEVAVRNTLTLMLEDKVFTLFDYVGTPTVTRVLPLLKKYDGLHFRLFTSFTGAQPQREAPYDHLAINLRASYRQETEGLVSNFRAIGRTRVAVFYQADAYGRSGWVGVRSALASQNQKMVGEATYARGTRYTDSLSRQVAILQASQPDVVISIGAYEASAAFIRDARRAGLNVPIANVSFVGSESMLELLRGERSADGRDYTANLVNSQVVPSYEVASVPVVQEYRELMAEHVATVTRQPLWDADYRPLARSFVSLEGFLNAKLLVEVLRRLGPNPSRAQLAGAVASVQDLDLGMGHPVSFAADRNQGSDAIFYTTVEEGRFVEIRDWKGWRK